MSGSQDGHLAVNQMKNDDINLWPIPRDGMALDLFLHMGQTFINSKFNESMSDKWAANYELSPFRI